jgi:hypothetical protein
VNAQEKTVNAVTKLVEREEPGRTLTPMDMVQQAVQSGAGLDVVSKLMDLHERWEANQARKDFDEAIAAAKAEIKPVARNKKGHNDKRYADFAAYAREVDPVLARYGLSYRFRTEQDERIKVTCILSHKNGHSETNTLAGPPDASGSKNAIQAIGSTLTYLQRYTLTQALGLAASDDDDGQAGGAGEPITNDHLMELRELIEATGADVGRFCKHLRVAQLSDLPDKRFGEAVAALKAKERRG